MADQYSGNMLVELMGKADHNQDIPRPEVELGGKVINVGGLKVSVGPEVIESWKRIEAEKQAANASGEPSAKVCWQGRNSAGKAFMKRSVAKSFRL
jgi:hypothetical protein